MEIVLKLSNCKIYLSKEHLIKVQQHFNLMCLLSTGTRLWLEFLAKTEGQFELLKALFS
jgi:hypothetical protein